MQHQKLFHPDQVAISLPKILKVISADLHTSSLTISWLVDFWNEWKFSNLSICLMNLQNKVIEQFYYQQPEDHPNEIEIDKNERKVGVTFYQCKTCKLFCCTKERLGMWKCKYSCIEDYKMIIFLQWNMRNAIKAPTNVKFVMFHIQSSPYGDICDRHIQIYRNNFITKSFHATFANKQKLLRSS